MMDLLTLLPPSNLLVLLLLNVSSEPSASAWHPCCSLSLTSQEPDRSSSCSSQRAR